MCEGVRGVVTGEAGGGCSEGGGGDEAGQHGAGVGRVDREGRGQGLHGR